MKLTESKLRRIIREELYEAVGDYDLFEYKLREVRENNMGGGLSLVFKLFMAPGNPEDESRTMKLEQQVKDHLKQFRLEADEIYTTGGDMLIVHLKNENVGANTVSILMDEGIEVDLTR